MDWGSYIISIAKSATRKTGALIRSMNFLSPEVALISINLPYSLAWNAVVMSGQVLLAATWNCQIRYKNVYVGLLVLHLLPLLNLGSLVKYYFGRCSSDQLVPCLYSQERSSHYSDRLHDFFDTIPRCYNKNVYVYSFFPCTARLWLKNASLWSKWL